MDAELDPAAELAAAQRRHRRRMLAVAGLAALAVAIAVALIAWLHRPGPAVPPIERPFLWEVRAPGGGPPSHLFGTIHIGYGVGDLPAAVRAAQDGARVTVLEADVLAEPGPPPPGAAPTGPGGEPAEPGAPAGADELTAPRPRGRDRLTAREWQRLAAMVGVDEESLVAWDTSHLVGAALTSQTPRVEAMDLGLQRRAVERGQARVFLETRQLEQVMDEAAILDGLRQIIAHPGALRGQLRRMIAAYASGADGRCSAGPLEGLTSRLNDDWLAAIEAEVARGGAFVAIGCGHLDGDDSIVTRLRARGYQVERVR